LVRSHMNPFQSTVNLVNIGIVLSYANAPNVGTGVPTKGGLKLML